MEHSLPGMLEKTTKFIRLSVDQKLTQFLIFTTARSQQVGSYYRQDFDHLPKLNHSYGPVAIFTHALVIN